jgi:hypothetical protein
MVPYDMDIWTEQLLGVLQSIEGSGRFITTGQVPLMVPGLYVDGVGEVPLPVPPNAAQALIAQAKAAPFGQGSQTITDDTVRKTWEIDASALSFRNPAWPDTLDQILQAVQQGLGLTQKDVQAHLYKLLIYETGGFFLPHQDSEKEAGMFGTLVIGLPSAHEGGTLHVRFGGEEQMVDFTSAVQSYQFPFAAFYADCEHEIQPVNEGYRVCLVYNLVQHQGEPILSPDIHQQVERLTALLAAKGEEEGYPQAILLEHHYTPTNFSRDSLKLHDHFRAEALLKAAENAGFMAQLGLLTYYLMGELEPDGYYDEYYRGDPDKGTMGDEIYEESTSIAYWAKDGPSLGEIPLSLAQVVNYERIGAGDPTRKQGEGYTGNAGMTMEYWYHYGAVVLWPRDLHPQLTDNLSVNGRMSWVRHDLAQGKPTQALQADMEAVIEGTEAILGTPSLLRQNAVDWEALVQLAPHFADQADLSARLTVMLAVGLPNLPMAQLEALLDQLPVEQVQAILETTGQTESPEQLAYLMELMLAKLGDPHVGPALKAMLPTLPTYLYEADLSALKMTRYQGTESPRQVAIRDCLTRALLLAVLPERDADWVAAMVKALHRPETKDRDYLERYLLPALTDPSLPASALRDALKAQVAERFEAETGEKPTPPADWRMEVPKAQNATAQNILNMLHFFLESPTERVFRYQKSQQNRDLVANVLRNHKLDVRCETTRSGRPHTLKIIKARSEYDQALLDWQANQAWLEKLRTE